MLNKHLFSCILIFLVLFSVAYAQDNKQSVLVPEVNGYLKLMDVFVFEDQLNENSNSILFHNRINFNWYFNSHWTASVQGRNRLFYGETIELQQPFFGNSLKQDNGLVDMSAVPVNNDKLVLHSIVDRAWIEFVKGKWNVKTGRQRINWGINLTWNPNDIFNSYNFLDFDYEERPGSDAIKITNYLTDLAFIEFAARFDEDIDNTVIATRYQFNKKGYDVQLLGGKFLKEIVLGTGWAGNIKDAGFKGELSYFHPYEKLSDNNGAYSFSTSLDYSFENGWYINGSYLFNSTANDKAFILIGTGLLEQNAKNLYPATHTYSIAASKPFTPLFNGLVSVVYSPKANALIVLPTLTYSLKQNLDYDVIVQSFFIEQQKQLKSLANGVYTRLKFSF